MNKKMRFTIRAKLAIMSMVSIAVAVTTLGVVLAISFSNAAYQTASATLNGVTANAAIALKSSITSSDTSMNLLAHQIGYKSDFANNIVHYTEAKSYRDSVKSAMQGEGPAGYGSSISGEMDYLIISENDIDSATMYSPYVDENVLNRLKPVSESQIQFTEERYKQIKDHSDESFWFFVNKDGKEQLFVWKAIINYGVTDVDDMQVVGYIEYGLNRESFLNCLTDTHYENEGMLLFDENGQEILNVGSGVEKVDKKVLKSYSSLPNRAKRYGSFTAVRAQIEEKNWTYVTYINHRSIEKTINRSTLLTIIIVVVSVIAAALIAYLLAAREMKRIRNLSKVAGAISNGDYGVRVKKVSNDEITDVSESFNTMAETVQETLKELILQQDSISENFATILSNKSGESGNHVKRVSEYSAILAQEMGFNENEVHDIRIASMLHDVGKIMVDESILHKPGRFTDEEYRIMQQHVVYGGKLLQGVPGNIMQLGAIIALYHHERWDGNGYVHGLKGDDIPKEAQITSVADVFDALVSKRCYKGPWSIEDAYNEIVNQSGKQFAPSAVEGFIKRFEDFKRIANEYKDEE